MVTTDFGTTEDILAILDTTIQLERERQEKEHERQLKERSVLLLLQKGTDMDLIAEVLRVPVEEIMDIQEKYKNNNPIDDILK
jgi:hypothetical protein